jgi:hypothetical protein
MIWSECSAKLKLYLVGKPSEQPARIGVTRDVPGRRFGLEVSLRSGREACRMALFSACRKADSI